MIRFIVKIGHSDMHESDGVGSDVSQMFLVKILRFDALVACKMEEKMMLPKSETTNAQKLVSVMARNS